MLGKPPDPADVFTLKRGDKVATTYFYWDKSGNKTSLDVKFLDGVVQRVEVTDVNEKMLHKAHFRGR